EIIGRKIFEATGACCAVGGIRYSPLTEAEKQALAFDEAEPSDDGMTYDEWEEMRDVKSGAVLKLIRFTHEVMSVTLARSDAARRKNVARAKCLHSRAT